MAVSLSVTTEKASMPMAFRLYLPEAWIGDRKRRKKTGVPDEIQFQTKPEIAMEQIQRARERGIPQGVVLADAGYGNDTQFSHGTDETGDGLCDGSPEHHDRLEAGRRTQAGASAQRQHGAATQTAYSAIRSTSQCR